MHLIPDSYIKNEALKLDIYRRIAAIEGEEEKDDMLEELIDRFGEPPTAGYESSGDYSSSGESSQPLY